MEKVKDIVTTHKNPHEHDGTIVDLPSKLPSSKKDFFNRKNTDNQLVNNNGHTKRVYIESYGCQMNFADSEIVASILNKANYSTTKD